MVTSHRIRYLLVALVLSWMALMLLTRPAHGAWSTGQVARARGLQFARASDGARIQNARVIVLP